MITLISNIKSKNYAYDNVSILASRLQECRENYVLALINQIPNLTDMKDKLDISNLWYLFDDIQDVNSNFSDNLFLDNLNISNDWIPVNKDNSVFFYENDVLKQVVELTKTGLVWRVNEYINGRKAEVFQYDTRGFLLYSIDYARQENYSKTWYDMKGLPVMTLEGEKITIHSKHRHRFKKKAYDSLEEVVIEFLIKKIETGLVISKYSKFLEILRGELSEHYRFRYISSRLSETRNVCSTLAENPNDMLVLEKKGEKRKLMELNSRVGYQCINNQIRVIPQYTPVFKLGDSNDILEEFIYWHIGDLSQKYMKEFAYRIYRLMKINENIRLVLCGTERKLEFFLDAVKMVISSRLDRPLTDLEEKTIKELFFHKKVKQSNDSHENELLKNEILRILDLFFTVDVTSGMASCEMASNTRLFVDTDSYGNQLLQTQAVSLGIPQIVGDSNGFVKQNRNGVIYSNLYDIVNGIEFFNESIMRWNYAVIENMKVIEKNSNDRIVHMWREEK